MISQLRNPAPIRWDFCAGLLPHGIEPTDLDLAFERHGHFLALEGKRPSEGMKNGQRRFLDALAALPNFTVIEFRGEPPDHVDGYSLWNGAWYDGTTQGLQALICEWFDWVEALAG